MFKKNTIFSKLFLSYLFIIVVTFIIFIGVFFYLFHINMYKNYEATYEHEYNKIEAHLQSKIKYDWTDDEFTESLSYTFTHADYHIYIIDENETKIFGPFEEQTTQLNDLSQDLMEKIIAGKYVSEGGFMNGKLRYVVASPLDLDAQEVDTPLFMVMVFHDMNHEYIKVILMIIITLSIALIFAGCILWYISKKFTKPLREMNEIAIEYAKGDFSKSVQYESNDEIGQLAKSFTYMAEELNNLESRRKQFVSNVTHDLRSPLTSIKGFLIAFLDGTIPEERRNHYYGIMKNETERMIKLVNDTLEMTQLEEGEHIISRADYNLVEQIERIIFKFEPQLEKKNLQIRFQSKYPSVYVYADEARIEQVLINLLQNAIQFSYPDSPIDIRIEKDEQQVKVHIRDYGEGIENSKLHAIWKRFYKADEARTNKVGFGLGLAIVKSILDYHDSEVTVDSTLGEGTTFTFTLPLSKNS